MTINNVTIVSIREHRTCLTDEQYQKVLNYVFGENIPVIKSIKFEYDKAPNIEAEAARIVDMIKSQLLSCSALTIEINTIMHQPLDSVNNVLYLKVARLRSEVQKLYANFLAGFDEAKTLIFRGKLPESTVFYSDYFICNPKDYDTTLKDDYFVIIDRTTRNDQKHIPI